MKLLYLARHAAAASSEDGISDLDRPLLDKGKKNAVEEGERLGRSIKKIELFISSPARRARDTASILASSFSYQSDKILINDILYEGSNPAEVLEILSSLNSKIRSVLLCGHIPLLQLTASELTEEFSNPLPPCGIVGIALNTNHWNDIKKSDGKLIYYNYPGK